jgi:hypothetical protein
MPKTTAQVASQAGFEFEVDAKADVHGHVPRVASVVLDVIVYVGKLASGGEYDLRCGSKAWSVGIS